MGTLSLTRIWFIITLCSCLKWQPPARGVGWGVDAVFTVFTSSPLNSPFSLRPSLSIRCFWGKGERWKRKRERGEGEKRLTQTLLLEPSTPTQHDSIPSNQNHFWSLGCHLHVSKSSPKINLTLRSDRAPVLVLLRFRFFLKPPMRSFWILVMENLPFLRNYTCFRNCATVRSPTLCL